MKTFHTHWVRLRALATLILLAMAVLLGPSRASAQATHNPPDRMTYQGFLVDGNGVPLGDTAPKNFNLVFRIYNDQSNGDVIWGEQQTVTVDKGYFSVLLGEGADSDTGDPRPVLSTVFTGADVSDRFVATTVKGIGTGGEDVDILPRLRLLTSPYAYLAGNASGLVSPDGSPLVTSADGQLTVNGDLNATKLIGNGSGLTDLTADQIGGVGTFSAALIPNLNASKINSGVLGTARIPNLDANKIASGTLSDARLGANVALRNGGNSYTGNQKITNGWFRVEDTIGSFIFQGFPSANNVANLVFLRAFNNAAPQMRFVGPLLGPGGFGIDIGLNSSGAFVIEQSDVEMFSVQQSGNVAIGGGTATQAKLVVNGSASNDINGTTYFQYLGITQNSGPVVREVGIYADNDIWSGSRLMVSSDQRMKNIRGRSDREADLQTLLEIEITDYQYKDVISKGNAVEKKVIAQQVEKIFPQAVSKQTDVVPDIYEKATVRDGWVALVTNLKAGDRVRLIGEKEEGIHEVLEVRESAFRTAFKPETETIFVYGREVNDFRTVDYEAISMLNVSATQELAKRLERLETRTSHLAELEQKAARVDTLERELADLKKLVAQLVGPGKVDKQAASVTSPSLQPEVKEKVSLQGTFSTAGIDR